MPASTHKNSITAITVVALTLPWLLVKPGTVEGTVDLAGTADTPHGIATDTAAIGEIIPIELLGISNRTLSGIASGAITYGDWLVPGAAGTVRKLPTAAGTYAIVGRALATVTDGDNVEYAHNSPRSITI